MSQASPTLRRILFWLALAVQLGLLAAMVPFSDFSNPNNAGIFVGLATVCGIAYFVAVNLLEHVQASRRTMVFWIAALLFRVVMLASAPGDDIWRYIWEGKIQHHGFNPYVDSPASERLVALRDGSWAKINNNGWKAIYPPAAELTFRGLAAISPTAIFFKIVFTLADLLAIALLLRLNTGGQRRHRDTAWYAWNPLVIYAFAGAGHFDSLMILAMVAGIWALHRSNPLGLSAPEWPWAILCAVFFGFAISLKLAPVLLLPLCIVALGRRALALNLSGLILAFLAWLYSYPHVRIWKPLRDFADVARVNDMAWWLSEKLIWPNATQKNGIYTLVLLIVVANLSLYFYDDWRRGMLWVLGAALILSPALHPWYVTWILPLASWRKSYPWFVLSITAFSYLLYWQQGIDPRFPLELWQRLYTIIPPLVLAAILWGKRRREAQAPAT